MRLNRAPVFLNGFARGGSNLVLNLLQSHPDLCVPAGELHEVFKGKPLGDSPLTLRLRRLFLDRPLRLATGMDFFNPEVLADRPVPRPAAQAFIDHVLFHARRRANLPFENAHLSRAEIDRARLLGKNLDGLILAGGALRAIFPDSTFFGLVRHGLALCEGRMRRGMTARAFGARYRMLVERMLDDATRFERCHVVRFEEVLADPRGSMDRLQRAAGLDPARVARVRLQVKARTGADGVRRLPDGKADREVVWCELDDFARHFDPAIDGNQIRKLAPSDAREFMAEASPVMTRLGYD